MSRMNNAGFFICLLCVAGVFLSTGCRDIRSFKEVEAAFDNPSGTLDQASAPVVLETSLRGRESINANSFLSSVDGVPGKVGSAFDYLTASSGQELGMIEQALFGECSPDLKFGRNGRLDEISVSCGSTGEYTGSATLDFDWNEDTLRGLYLDYDMLCDAYGCIDGSMGIRWSVDGAVGAGLATSFLATARFSLIQGDETYSVDWAWRVQMSEDEGKLEWLVWTSPDRGGESYVLSAVVNPTGGYLEIRDSIGWWRCDYGAEAMEGACYRCEMNGAECVPDESQGQLTWSVSDQ